jgi:Tol biopolymer transport system component
MVWNSLRCAGQAVVCLLVVCVAAVGAQEKKAKQANDDAEPLIFIGEPDGSGMKPLVDLGEYRTQGAPCWSQDGTMVAFHAWRPGRGEKDSDARVVVVKADGSEAKILGDGAFPSFSPQHQRIVFTRYAPNPGVWVMSLEGPEKELVQLDNGWGAGRWSPDGRRIAYTTTREMEINLYVYDLIEGQETAIFDHANGERNACPYSSFFRNITWSPDGTKIAFKGQRRGAQTFEIAIVDARGAQHGLKTRYEAKTLYNVAWDHDGSRILFAQPTAGETRVQLFTVNAKDESQPELLAGQDTTRGNNFGVISPDGKRMLIVSRKAQVELAKEKGKKK